jgi:hypothetical protein
MRLRNRNSTSVALQWEGKKKKRKKKKFELNFAHNKFTRHTIASISAAPAHCIICCQPRTPLLSP